MNKLLEMSFESAKAVPRVHKAERLARGVKVVDTDPVSNPGSPQGGAEWRVTEYQPERILGANTLHNGAGDMATRICEVT
jgi:hypothetical protein